MTSKNGEKVGALSARVDLLIDVVKEQRTESRTWREETKSDIANLRMEIGSRIEKSEQEDRLRHSENVNRMLRIEGAAEETNKALTERVNVIERAQTAQEAVDRYRKWIVGIALVAGGSLTGNAVSLFKMIAPVLGVK